MEIIKTYPEEMDKKTKYRLMKSPNSKKMSDADGKMLSINAWVMYSSEDFSTGEVHDVLSIMTNEGEIYATISSTFIKEFKDIITVFGDEIDQIEVISRESRAGRKYITCTV